jgi:hypothetical protein
MTVNMPIIDIEFQQLSSSLIDRSERGIAIIIIKDVTAGAVSYKEYSDIATFGADESLYTPVNYQYLNDIFAYALNEVVVVNMGESGTLGDALTTIQTNVSSGWITIADGLQTDYNTLASWIKSTELLKQSYKAVTYKATTTDCKHIVNFYNDNVTFVDSDGRGQVTGEKYCPSLIGILASCNILRGSTYFKCSNLKHVTEVADRNVALEAGQFILVNDGSDVRIGLGINSMVTLVENDTEDMKFIDIIEALDLMTDDITNVFKNTYLGFKNKYDNQVLFISAVNTYLSDIADADVLDDEYKNLVDINVAKQRLAWIGSGKTEASTWSDTQVKTTTFKRSVFLGGDVKVLGAMENLNLDISLC